MSMFNHVDIHKQIIVCNSPFSDYNHRLLMLEKIVGKPFIWITPISELVNDETLEVEGYYYDVDDCCNMERYEDIFEALKARPDIKHQLLDFWVADQQRQFDVDYPNSSL